MMNTKILMIILRETEIHFLIVFIKNEYCRSQTVLFKDFYEPE
jgi:hypothetical protein